MGEEGSKCKEKAPLFLRPTLESKRGSKIELKKGPPLHAPLERFLAPSVGILAEMSSGKGLETRSKWGPKIDLKEEPSKNIEKVSSIHDLLGFSHVGRSKKHYFLGHFLGAYLVKKAGPEKDTSKIHLCRLPWLPGGTQCDFWVPIGTQKTVKNEAWNAYLNL